MSNTNEATEDKTSKRNTLRRKTFNHNRHSILPAKRATSVFHQRHLSQRRNRKPHFQYKRSTLYQAKWYIWTIKRDSRRPRGCTRWCSQITYVNVSCNPSVGPPCRESIDVSADESTLSIVSFDECCCAFKLGVAGTDY